MSFFSSRRGAQPSFPSRCANRSFSRKAEIVDGLVLMIAGTLLPAWLLGHLFLSFYPAPESATDPTNTVASESMGDSDPGEGKIPGAEGEAGKSGSALADTNSSKTVTHTFAPRGSKSADIESKIAELELENRTLKSEMMSSQADSNVVGQLRGQLNMTSQELTTTKENLTNTESRLRTTEAEMQTLRSNLSETQSRLQLAQTNLENAKQMATPAAGDNSPFSAITSDNNNQANEIAKAEATIVELQRNIETLTQQTNDKITVAEGTIAQLQRNVQTITQQANASKDALAIRDQELRTATLELKEMMSNSANNDQTNEIAKAEATIVELQRNIETLTQQTNDKITVAEGTIAQLQRNVQTITQQANASKDALAIRDRELQTASLELKAIATENTNLKAALTAASRQSTQQTSPAAQTQLAPEVYREFVSSKGSVSKMAFVRWENDEVIVRSFTNKKLYRLSLDRFSDDDQKYLLDKK